MKITEADILAANLLIVDDQESNVALLEQILAEAGFTHVISTMNPYDVCALHRRHSFDLILLDLSLRSESGHGARVGTRSFRPHQPWMDGR